MYTPQMQNFNVPSTYPSAPFNYDSSNSNQTYRFSIPPSLPPPHGLIPKHNSKQKWKTQRSSSIGPYQPYCQNYSSHAPCYPPLLHPYPTCAPTSSYRNIQPVNGYVYPPIPYGPQPPSTAHSNGFNDHRRFSNSQHRRPLPSQTMSFHCESCDRGFTAKEKYDEHVAEHMTCDRDGCSFTAHPKIVEKHVIMQHNTGLFKRIVKGNNPEEIEKWIGDRKKQYPTSKKIEEKQQQKEAMDKRGERYNDENKGKTPRSCSFNSRGRRNYNTNRAGEKSNLVRRPNWRNSRTRQTEKRKDCAASGSHKQDYEKLNDDDILRNLPRFLGTAHFDSSITLEKTSSPYDEPVVQPCDFSSVTIAPTKNFFFDVTDLDLSDDNNDIDCLPKHVQADNFSPKELPKAKISINERPNLASVSKISSMNLIQCYNSSESDNNESSSESSDEKNTAKDFDVEFEEKNVDQAIMEEISDECEQINIDLSIRGDHDDECQKEYKENGTTDDDDNKPEEKSSKLSKHVESDSSIRLPSEDSSIPSSSNSEKKQARKRKRHKDEKKEEVNAPAPSLAKFPAYKRFRKPTLLEKLLAPEIRHERNVILQCVRYVVENKFFGLDNS